MFSVKEKVEGVEQVRSETTTLRAAIRVALSMQAGEAKPLVEVFDGETKAAQLQASGSLLIKTQYIAELVNLHE